MRSQLDNLVLPLEHARMAVDVFSATCDTPMTAELMDLWHPWLRVDKRQAKEGSSQASNAWSVVSATLAYALARGLSYDVVVVLRHDMRLEQNLGKMIADLCASSDGRFDRFLVPFKDYDTLQVMAGRFLPAFQQMLDHGKIWPGEGIWDSLQNVVGKEHMGLVEADVFADSDPAKARNPLYAFAGRGEAQLMTSSKEAPSPRPMAVSEDFRSSWPLFLLLAVGLCCFFIGGHVAPLLPEGPLLSAAICAVYVCVSVSIDVFIKTLSLGDGFAFNEITMVLVTEVSKLAFSAVLLAISRLCCPGAPQGQAHTSDVGWMAIPAALFAMNNAFVFVAIGANDTAVFGVFRETAILWTAGIWTLVFQMPLGHRRLIAMSVLVSGLLLNQVFQRVSGNFGWSFLWVLVMTLCNASGSVANEYALKRNKALDINVQNMALYTMCALCCVAFLAVTKPATLTSPGIFFHGFSKATWTCAGLQACAGLLVSRLLKYSDSVMKAAAVCMRGPVLVMVAPIFVPSKVDRWSVLTAFIVAVGSLGYMMQGPITVAQRK